MYLQITLAQIQRIFIDEDQSFTVEGNILKATLKGRNRTQKVLEWDTRDIGSGSIHVHYHKLPDESKSNKKESVKPNALYVISDLAEFSRRGFRDLNYSKRYGPKVNNISTKLSKPREIVYTQKFVIVSWRAWVQISSGIFLPSANIYQLKNYK